MKVFRCDECGRSYNEGELFEEGEEIELADLLTDFFDLDTFNLIIYPKEDICKECALKLFKREIVRALSSSACKK